MRGPRSSWRAAAAFYVTAFLLAAAAAPNAHVNDLEDLLLDQPSDSGVVVETNAAFAASERSGQPGLDAFTIVDDVPCLACFGSDFVSVPTTVVRYTPTLDRVVLPRSFTRPGFLPPTERETPSRGPPRTA